jgi:hypothetical protein
VRAIVLAWCACGLVHAADAPGPRAGARGAADKLVEAALTPAMQATSDLADAASSPATLAELMRAADGHGEALKVYVALDGNDAWTGENAEPDKPKDGGAKPGEPKEAGAGPDGQKANGPFRTLERARDEIRARKRAGTLPNGAVVLVRGGRFELSQAFRLTAADSGAAGAPIVYRAYPGEKPVLSGATTLRGWEPHKGRILKADTTAQGFNGYLFRQLFMNGKRQTLARFPNYDPSGTWDGKWTYVRGEPLPMYEPQPNDNQRLLPCASGVVHAWENPQDGLVNIYPRFNWWNRFVKIASVDAAASTITLAGDAGFAIRPLDRFYVCNLLEELDAPGEWFLDPRTKIVYFWPPQPLDASAFVSAPRVKHVVSLERGTAHVTVRGFTLECSDGPALNMDACEHCLAAGNTVTNAVGTCDGGAAISVSGGRHNGVVGNDISESCCHGVSLIGGSRETLEPGLHYADNNYIHHIGRLNGHGCGVYLGGVGLRVSRNLIHDTSRCGIFGGDNDCIYEYNHLRHLNLATEDTAGIYVGGPWSTRGAVFRYNYIHDMIGFGRTGRSWVAPHFAWALYLDDGRCEAHVYGNILVRTMLGGLYIHAGHDNLLENNILVDHTRYQMNYQGHNVAGTMDAPTVEGFQKDLAKYQKNPAYAKYRGFATMSPGTADDMARNAFVRNILSFTDPKAKAYRQLCWPDAVRATCVSDYNLVHHAGLPLEVDLPNIPAEKQWAAWQKLGFDTHSVVADPLFQNPAKDDYRLKRESPAHALGFRPIPFEKIGPQQSPLRASWPIREAPGVRETPMRLDKAE